MTALAMRNRRRGNQFERRRRGRNLALLALLVAFVLIIYLVTIVKWSSLSGG